MRHFVTPLLIIILNLIITGCNNKEDKRKTNFKNSSLLENPIKNKIILDSTIIGTSTIATDLNVPWEMTWGPDNWIWITEQDGRVSRINPKTGEKILLLDIAEDMTDIFVKRTTGLLGMAIHPDIKEFPYVFLNYTYKNKTEDTITSKLVRYEYKSDSLINPLILLEIPGSTGHNGARVAIAPDGKIIWSTGDAHKGEEAQDPRTLNGKILRLNIDGTVPGNNPFPDNPVWSLGHRNHQGVVFGLNNTLYTSEHGDATDDEINIIRRGGNYGWPKVTGYCDRLEEKSFCKDSVIVEPIKAWTPTIAPAGIDFYNSASIPEWKNSLLLTTLKESDLRVLKLDSSGNAIISEKIYFDNELGRLRDICVSPDGDIFISTSNRDWNPGEGFPKEKDDRIIKIFKIGEEKGMSNSLNNEEQVISERSSQNTAASEGRNIYKQYCASCHKNDGKGLLGVFPPLRGAQQVSGDKKQLIQIVLNGLSGPIEVQGEEYNQSMPSFDFLKDEELAKVLTYIRSEFGNDAGKITSEEISNMRKE